MGDSYTSGMGVGPYVGNEKCYRSASAYPLLAANTLGYVGRNVSCAGADTQDVATDYNGDPSQIGQLNDPDWVVMTVGSNNVDLSGAILQDEVSVSTMMSRIPNVSKSVEGVLTSVQKAAPNAEVILVNHPDVLPAQASALTCLGDKASSVDLPNMHKAYAQFNAALKTAATNAKAIYVDTAPTFVGHDVCAKDSWVTGLDNADAAFHLNLAGDQQVANLVVAAIKKVDGATAVPVTSTTVPKPVVSTTTAPTTSTTAAAKPVVTLAPTTTAPEVSEPAVTEPPVTLVPATTSTSTTEVDIIESDVTDVPTPPTPTTSAATSVISLANSIDSVVGKNVPSTQETPTTKPVTSTTALSNSADSRSDRKKSDTQKKKWAKRHNRRHHCLGHRQRQWSFVQQDDDAGRWAP
jgi:hypothetical protein